MVEAIKNPIPYYLSACYAYEELNTPIMSDEVFDRLGQLIYDRWATIQHPHKWLIDPSTCYFTSGVTRPYHKWPSRIRHATHTLIDARRN